MEDTKVVIGVFKLKKNRKHNGHKKRNKMTNTDLRNTTLKTTDRTARIPLKTGDELRAPDELAIPAPLVTPFVLLLNNTNII